MLFSFKKNIFLVLVLLFLFFGADVSASEDDFYSISLGHHAKQAEAEKAVEELKKAGHDAFFMEETKEDSENRIYRIYIEKYASGVEAEAEARVLKELGLISDYSVKKIAVKTPDKNGDMEQKTTEPVEISNSAAEKDKNHETETGEISKEKKTDPFQSYSEQHKPDGVYIRIGSFSEKSNADSLLKTLIHSGYNAFYRHEDTGKKGNYYRIYIDGYKSKKDAMNDAEMLKGSGLISDYLINPELMKEAGTPPQNGKADKNTVFLHVSSFQEKEHAEKEVKRFTDSGLEAFIKEEMIDNRYWFRVYLGGFADEKKAREAAEGLKERGIISYFKPMRLDKPGSNQ